MSDIPTYPLAWKAGPKAWNLMSDKNTYPCAWNAGPKAWNLMSDIPTYQLHEMPGLKPGI